LAALVSAPTVGIFGPTILEFGFRPWNSNAIVVETHKQLTCRPCGKHGPQVCPVGTHECMESINVETVWKAGQILLSR
jgi:heptosyltransferase-2